MLTAILLVMLVLVGVGGYFVFKNKFKTNQSIAGEMNSNPIKEENKTEEVYRGLLNINVKVREEGLSELVLNKTENIIDIIMNIVEELNKKENFSELTVTVNRMHTKYLPSLLNPYIQLDKKGRKGYEETIVNKLWKIEEELLVIKEAVDSKNFGEFEKMSRFIDAMFTKTENSEI